MIFITGDVHGDYDDLNSRELKSIKKGDKLIITGDFGFIWDNSEKEIKALKKLSKKKYDILFVEGAHENFDRIRAYPECDLYRAKGYKIDHNIYCLKRGEIYQIDGKTVFTLGGGIPPYMDESEFDAEKSMPTEEELKYAVDNIQREGRSVDLIITHEAPASIKRVIDRSAKVNDLNIFLDTVLHNTRYKKWFFGSLHQDHPVSENLICVWQDVYRVE